MMTSTLTERLHLWRRRGPAVARNRQSGVLCLKTSTRAQNLRQKSHTFALAAREKVRNAGIVADFNDNRLNRSRGFWARLKPRESLLLSIGTKSCRRLKLCWVFWPRA